MAPRRGSKLNSGPKPLPSPPGMKTCRGCLTPKPLSEFNRQRHCSGGLYPRCKACVNVKRREYRSAPEIARREAERTLSWKKANPTQQQDYYLRKRFGITFDDYSRMCSRQHGRCAICGRPPGEGRGKTFLHVDHDHTTGEVRGLLCNSCNLMIGLARDQTKILKAAAKYLDWYAVWRAVAGPPKMNGPQLPLFVK